MLLYSLFSVVLYILIKCIAIWLLFVPYSYMGQNFYMGLILFLILLSNIFIWALTIYVSKFGEGFVCVCVCVCVSHSLLCTFGPFSSIFGGLVISPTLGATMLGSMPQHKNYFFLTQPVQRHKKNETQFTQQYRKGVSGFIHFWRSPTFILQTPFIFPGKPRWKLINILFWETQEYSHNLESTPLPRWST